MSEIILFMQDKQHDHTGYASICTSDGAMRELTQLAGEGKYGSPFTRWKTCPQVREQTKLYPGLRHPFKTPVAHQTIEEKAFIAWKDIFSEYFLEAPTPSVMVALTPNDYLIVEIVIADIVYTSSPFRIEELPTVAIQLLPPESDR